jgi:hypothetical protein
MARQLALLAVLLVLAPLPAVAAAAPDRKVRVVMKIKIERRPSKTIVTVSGTAPKGSHVRVTVKCAGKVCARKRVRTKHGRYKVRFELDPAADDVGAKAKPD